MGVTKLKQIQFVVDLPFSWTSPTASVLTGDYIILWRQHHHQSLPPNQFKRPFSYSPPIGNYDNWNSSQQPFWIWFELRVSSPPLAFPRPPPCLACGCAPPAELLAPPQGPHTPTPFRFHTPPSLFLCLFVKQTNKQGLSQLIFLLRFHTFAGICWSYPLWKSYWSF